MKTIASLLSILIITLNFSANAQYLDNYPTKENTLLWKIEGKKVKKNSYIFGTIHMIDKDQFYFPEEFKKIIKKSKQVVLEISNLNQAEAMQHLILQKGSFFDFFTAEQQDSLLVWAKEQFVMDADKFRMTFGRMKPFAVIQMASQKDLIGKIESYDMTIQSIANANKIPVLGLETIEQQIAIFDNMDSLKLRNMVMDLVRKPHNQMDELQKMFDIYLKQNVDAMHDHIASNGGSMMESSEELLYQRNRNWVPKIRELVRKKRTLIAVGAGHLGGEEGVLRLLEKWGYKLTPVKF
jgi:uncharacterized protein